jgi:restriction system protein
MLPLLQYARDEREKTVGDATQDLAAAYNLTPEEEDRLLLSRREPIFMNRVRWAVNYLNKAGLLAQRDRECFRLTKQGAEVLASGSVQVSIDFLHQYPEFQEFLDQSRTGDKPPLFSETEKTPEELLEENYLEIRRNLAHDLLTKIKSCSPKFFEHLVVDLLLKMGYGGSRREAGQVIGQSGDGGIDGMIKEDKLGLDLIYLQAKRWQGTVGRPIVQAFTGSLEGVRARKGVLITTSRFSQEAQEYVTTIEKRIVLINGAALVELMLDYNVGVVEVGGYRWQKLDNDYFQ